MSYRCKRIAAIACLLALSQPALAEDPAKADRFQRRMTRAVAPETLQNPGFETSDAKKRVSAWTAIVHADDSYRVEADDTQAFSGKHSLVIQNTGRPSWGGAIQTIRADRLANREITFSAQVKSMGATAPGFQMALRLLKTGQEIAWIKTPAVTGDADWKKLSLQTTIPKDCTDVEINLILDGDGRVWVDDVRLDAQ